MRERHLPGFSLLLVSLLLFGPDLSTASAVPSPTRQAAGDIAPAAHDPDSLLVRFRPETSPMLRAEARGQVRGRLLRAFNLVPGLEHLGLSGLEVEKALAILRLLPQVLYAEPDFMVHQTSLPDDPYFSDQWGLHNAWDMDLNAPEAWHYTAGDPDFVVAVIDSGIQLDHPDLAANLWVNPGEISGNGVDDDGNGYVDDVHGWDWYNDDNDPADDRGHGTHVAGIIGAAGNNGLGVAGVAWQVQLMALKFLSSKGSGFTSDAVRALEYAVGKQVKISNNSWGGGSYSQALSDAIQASRSVGHLFVAAAGNQGEDNDSSPHYPASYGHDNVLAVAAVEENGSLAAWSNYGAGSVDLGAPGASILSTFFGSDYSFKSGTSMATPHVAGVAALVYGLYPELAYGEVRDRILGTVRPLASLQGKTASGGMVNAGAAVLGSATVPAAPSGLAATAASDTAIGLTWIDHADNEFGFEIERSPEQTPRQWERIAVANANSTSYADSGLLPETIYRYRLSAYNSAGSSGYSNEAWAKTHPPPPYHDQVADGETLLAGSVSGTFRNTWSADGVYQVLTEQESGGKPERRYSHLEHKWTFPVRAGTSMTFFVKAHQETAGDGDTFIFSCSTDDVAYQEMLAIDATAAAADGYQSFPLLPSTTGTVHVRVVDSDRIAGNRARDSLLVDHLYIRSETAVGTIPDAPSALAATAVSASRIDLRWSDNSGDEYGFEIERRDGAAMVSAFVGAGVTGFSDQGLAPGTLYQYRVRAYNGAGVSGYSDPASATTLEGALTLSATAYKVKGVQTVDLQWRGAATVEIFRDGVPLGTVTGSAYTDSTGNKGGGSYTYQVCASDGGGNCSDPATVTF